MTPTRVAPPFAESFWGAQDRGFDVLMERMRVAKHTSAELQAAFAARADMEDEYARKLVKLARGLDADKKSLSSSAAAATADELGGLKASLVSFKEEMEAQAKCRQTLADNIRAQLDKPMAAFINQQRDRRKEHQTAVEKSLKAKQAQTSLTLKAEEKYKARCVEVDQLTAQRAQTRLPKEVEKLDVKLLKATTASRQADIDYQQAVDKLHELHGQWIKDWVAGCDEFQRLEEERIGFLRAALWSYANLNSAACVGDDESSERLRKTLEKCAVPSDIAEFVRVAGTGTAIPPPLEYCNFYTGHTTAQSTTTTMPAQLQPAALIDSAAHSRQASANMPRSASAAPPATPPRSVSVAANRTAMAGSNNDDVFSAVHATSASAPPRIADVNPFVPHEDEDGRGAVLASVPRSTKSQTFNPFDDDEVGAAAVDSNQSAAQDVWGMAEMGSALAPNSSGRTQPTNPFDD